MQIRQYQIVAPLGSAPIGWITKKPVVKYMERHNTMSTTTITILFDGRLSPLIAMIQLKLRLTVRRRTSVGLITLAFSVATLN